jgi:hypothetical protein
MSQGPSSHSLLPALPATCAAAGLASLRRRNPCLLLALAPTSKRMSQGPSLGLRTLGTSEARVWAHLHMHQPRF